MILAAGLGVQRALVHTWTTEHRSILLYRFPLIKTCCDSDTGDAWLKRN